MESAATSFRLYKKEKLCSAIAIDALFGRRTPKQSSALCYPLRAVWMTDERRRSDASVAFLISVPKKRLRHAVDRVLMRRRIREAYRLRRHLYPMPCGSRIDLAFIYVADRTLPYADVDRAVCRVLEAVAKSQRRTESQPKPAEQ